MSISTKKKKRSWFRPLSLLALVILLMLVVASTAAQEGTVPLERVQAEEDPNFKILKVTVGDGFVRAQAQVSASEDAFVSSAFPNNNFGGDPNLRIGYDIATYQAERSLVKYNLSPIPSGATIDSAQWQFFQNAATPVPDNWFGGMFSIQGRYLASNWSEFSVTWNTSNPIWGDVIGVTETNTTSGIKFGDATNVVRNWYSGSRPNYGVLLQGDESPDRGRQRIFDSRNKSGGFRPIIIVTYTLYTDTCPPTSTVNSLPQWSQSSIGVSWSGTDCGSGGQAPSGIAYYDVQYSTNNSSWIQWLNGTTSTSATFQGVNGNTYYFRSRAVDNAGNIGAWSSSKSTTVDTVAPTINLNVPGIAGVDGYNFPSFQVFWNGSDNLSGIKQFTVQFRQAGAEWSTRTFPPSQTSEWATGAIVGKTYEIQVQSVDNAGNTSPWDATSTTIVNDPWSTILSFQPILYQDAGDLPITVKWVGFSSTTITNFEVKMRINGGAWTTWGDFPGTQGSAPFDPATEIPGFDANQIYNVEFEVAATAQSLPLEPFEGKPQGLVTIDLSGKITLTGYLPIVSTSD